MKFQCSSGRSQSRAIDRQTRQIEENARRQQQQALEAARMNQMQLEQQQNRERTMETIRENERNQLQQSVQVDVTPQEREVRIGAARIRVPVRERFRNNAAKSSGSGLNI